MAVSDQRDAAVKRPRIRPRPKIPRAPRGEAPLAKRPPPPASDGQARVKLTPWLAAAVAVAADWVQRRARGASPPEPVCVTPDQFDAREPGRGRAAKSPLSIPAKGWKDILWRTYREFGRARLPSLAGAVTFFLVLAVFPGIAAFASLYGLFYDVTAVARQLDRLSEVFPADAVALIGQQMLRVAAQAHGTLGAAFAVSALISIWSANAGMKALFDGVNIAYNEIEKRPYLLRTLIAYAATLAALIFLTLVTALAVALPVSFHHLGIRPGALWSAPLRWFTIYLIAALGFTLIYRLGASRRAPRWRWVAGGGLAAAAVWMLGSMGFSGYLNTFTHFGVTYGSLAAVMGFMLWVWFSVLIVLLGAEFNAEIEHQTAVDTTIGRPKRLGERGAVMADTVGAAFTVSPAEAVAISRAFLGRQVGYVLAFFRKLARI
jgi:membrane protein